FFAHMMTHLSRLNSRRKIRKMFVEHQRETIPLEELLPKEPMRVRGYNSFARICPKIPTHITWQDWTSDGVIDEASNSFCHRALSVTSTSDVDVAPLRVLSQSPPSIIDAEDALFGAVCELDLGADGEGKSTE
ncbi:hypothetical protein C0995_002926, partial [Termitomyces sp. Mi166